MSARWEVVVFADQCDGYGHCVSRAPEVFVLSAGGAVELLQPNPADALRSAVEAAVSWCPKGVISIREQR